MYNVLKFQAPFERLKEYSNFAEVNLFKSVIVQAITDISNISEKPKNKAIRQEVIDWISGGSDYFQMACDFAGIEPAVVIKLAYEAMELSRKKAEFKKVDFDQKIVHAKKEKGRKNVLEIAA
jgi:hypothetical protein